MANYQCDCFNDDPKIFHEQAVKCIGRYLLDTKYKGLIYKTDITQGFECYANVDFSGGLKHGDHECPESVIYRTGFVIMYA